MKTPKKKTQAVKSAGKPKKTASIPPAGKPKKASKSAAKKISVSAKKPVSKTAVKVRVKAKTGKAKKLSDKAVSVSLSKGKKSESKVEIRAKADPVEPVVVPKKQPQRPAAVDRPSHHIAFTLEDLDAYFENVAKNEGVKSARKEPENLEPKRVAQPVKKQPKGEIKLDNKSEGVATIFDILGFNPVETPSVEKLEERDVPRKWKKYYALLVDLRKRYSSGVASRSEEVMKRSAKEDSGDLSSYGQHLADAGSGSFERDLAYNMISNQTEVLAEIEAAIERIKNGTYGICEVTGKPIPEKRLEAIPFTRYTKEGQEIHESQLRRVKNIRRDSGVYDMGMDSSSGSQSADDDDGDSSM